MINYTLPALGMVNAIGTDIQTIWKGVLSGNQGHLAPWTVGNGQKTTLVGRVPIEDANEYFPPALSDFRCRNNVLILKAYEQIETIVQDRVRRFGAGRIGVVLGSSTSGVRETEAAVVHRLKTGSFPECFHYIQHELGGASDFLARLVGIRGPCYTISTACSSSAKAFASARALIRDGWCDAVLVGGADSLCRLTVEGFVALESLSSEPANSMSRNRRGFNIGEGASLFLLERSDTTGAVGPAQNGDSRLMGIGESSDAYHMSAPSPNGKGALSAMRQALQDAELSAAQISYINLHGTGTLLNDSMEALAVSQLFPDVPASSTKGVTGHTLGAAGAMEIGLCWMSLKFRESFDKIQLPPHCWDGEPEMNFPKIKLVPPGFTVGGLNKGVFYMSNSFGFGGSNCSVIIGSRFNER